MMICQAKPRSAHVARGRAVWTRALAPMFSVMVASCGGDKVSVRPDHGVWGDAGIGGESAEGGSSGPTLIPNNGHLSVTVDDAGGMPADTSPPPPDPGNVVLKPGNVPADVVDQFAAGTAIADEPATALVYPSPETMFPPDLGRILFQWKAPAKNLFRLHFRFPKNTLDVYTDGAHEVCTQAALGAKCWESSKDDLTRDFMFEAGSTFTLQISRLDPGDPTKVHQSPEHVFHLAPSPALGVVYYWSTTQKGVRRATLDGRGASDYLTPWTGLTGTQAATLPQSEQDARCTACHTVSRSGKKMSVSLQGDQLGIVQVTDAVPPPFSYASLSSGVYGKDPTVGASWVTFNHDETKIISAANGILTIRDISVEHRAPGIGTISLSGPSGAFLGSMPDWAPDDQRIVFTATQSDLPTASKARHIRGSSIGWMKAQGDNFGELEILAASKGILRADCIDNASPAGPGRESYANPMFSPDSKWLVFSRGDCESERDPSAELLLMEARSGAAMNHLVRANTVVGGLALSNLTNGMPTWGPRIDGGIAWIAFTTTRDYGLVIAPSSALLQKIGYPVRQLWVAAIDLSKLASGQDPSYPAFRIPSQDYDENNHRPFWTRDVLPPNFIRKDEIVK